MKILSHRDNSFSASLWLLLGGLPMNFITEVLALFITC
jgi:hypothetical protein